jgi:hypothetical protein
MVGVDWGRSEGSHGVIKEIIFQLLLNKMFPKLI